VFRWYAADILYTGKKMMADEADRIVLVNAVIGPGGTHRKGKSLHKDDARQKQKSS
jgi:hypothetical protein